MKGKIDFSEYTKFLEHLKAKDIMNPNVIYLTADKTVAMAKEMMRIKKISGIPIVSENKKVVGIISIEDIIKCLENNKIASKIQDVMTKNVITVNLNDLLPKIIELFDTFKFGRFPVVDSAGKLKGIITREDILHAIIEKFKLIYIHDEKREKKLSMEVSLITGEKIDIKEAEFNYKIDSSDIYSAGEGAATLKKFLKEKGYSEEVVRRIGIATYEAETNVVIHSKSHGEIYCFLKKDRIIVRVVDYGVGIDDLDMAMKEGFSTAPDYVRELGFGAGMGIPNMKRFADKLVILSEKGSGTQVEMVFYLK